jgi:hypothetical protein
MRCRPCRAIPLVFNQLDGCGQLWMDEGTRGRNLTKAKSWLSYRWKSGHLWPRIGSLGISGALGRGAVRNEAISNWQLAGCRSWCGTPPHLSSRPSTKEPATRATEGAWRDPEDACSTMTIQGVLPKSRMRRLSAGPCGELRSGHAACRTAPQSSTPKPRAPGALGRTP